MKPKNGDAIWQMKVLSASSPLFSAPMQLGMAPESPRGYMALGYYYRFLAVIGKSPRENYKKAFKLAQKALSLDESDPSSNALLGKLYLGMRQYEKAIAAGERSIELDPNGALVHGLLGKTLCRAGRINEGIDQLKQGIRLNPFPEYFFFSDFGGCYLQKGQYENALTEYKKALQLAPESPPLHGYLAVTYILLDREEEARSSAEKALELFPISSKCFIHSPAEKKAKALLSSSGLIR